MKRGAPGSFGAHLKSLREKAGFTQEELATIAGLSVHAVSALERGERRRPQLETLRALAGALDLAGTGHDSFVAAARPPERSAAEELSTVSVPLPLTPLIGREAEMAALRRALDERFPRLITLTGPGGVGKTRLALEVARAVAADGAARVVFVSLAANGDAALVPSVIAEAFGFSDVTATDLPRRARGVCHDHPTLLFLDNFEHVLSAAPIVTELLMAVPSLQAVVTSRAPLRLRGEREYIVGPLPLESGGESLSPDAATACPAVRLFVERARDVYPDFALSTSNHETIAAICRRLDALPLALELAAPWIKMLSAEGLLHRLNQDVLLSTDAPRDLPERQRTMNATVAWSYRLLQPDEQRAFRRFGAFPGLFPIDAAAEALSGRQPATSTTQALAAAARLIDKSLLSRADASSVPTCPLYQMLETVRAYAVLQLAATGERDEAMEGLVRYCCAEAALAAEGLVGPRQAEWLDRVREDLESYRAAFGRLLDGGRADEASRIAWALLFFWVIRGHGAEGLRWYEAILGLPSLEPAVEARALAGTAIMHYTQGQLTRAKTALTAALALAARAGEADIVAEAKNMLGHVEHAAGNLAEARNWFLESVAAFEALAVPWGVGNGLSGLAWVALAAGDLGRAERLLDDARPALDRADRAIAFVRESLTRILALQDTFALVYALVPLAAAAILEGDDAWAARILGTRDAITERTGAAFLDPSVRDLREQAERDARARLGPDRWALAYATGRRTTIDGLLGEIDGALRR